MALKETLLIGLPLGRKPDGDRIKFGADFVFEYIILLNQNCYISLV